MGVFVLIKQGKNIMFLKFKYIKSKMNKVVGTKWIVLKCDNCNKIDKVQFSNFVNTRQYKKLNNKEKKNYIPNSRFCSNKCRWKHFKELGCKIKDCNKPYSVKGYCRNHREMERRYGDPLGNICKYCGGFFYVQGRKHKERLKILPRCCWKCFKIEIRKLVFKKYGNKCNCCGEKEIRFLQLDHIKGGGKQHRNLTDIYSIYEEALTKTKKYQVLCGNCNFGRELNGGICPHKEI